MKIIFLDIDGVLNSAQSMKESNEQIIIIEMYNDMPHKMHLKHLQEMVDKTNAKVIITSTWRLGCSSVRMWMYLFHLLGFKIDIVDTTPRVIGGKRGQEIETWIKRNNYRAENYNKSWDYEKVDSFVILDDDSDMEPYMDRLVQTSFETGLQKEHVDKAIKVLERRL